MLGREAKRDLARLIRSADCLDIFEIIRILQQRHQVLLSPIELVNNLGVNLRAWLLENMVNQPWVSNAELMAHGFAWEEIVNMRRLASRKQQEFEVTAIDVMDLGELAV